MARPKGKTAKVIRRLTVLLTEEDDMAARIVGAARCLAGKRPSTGTAMKDLLRQEAHRLEAKAS